MFQTAATMGESSRTPCPALLCSRSGTQPEERRAATHTQIRRKVTLKRLGEVVSYFSTADSLGRPHITSWFGRILVKWSNPWMELYLSSYLA